MQTKNIKMNRLAEKNLLDIFSCPLVSGFMIDSELSKDFFNKTKEFFVLGYSAEPQQELDVLRIITQSTKQIESDIERGHCNECESLRSRHIISTNIIMSMAILFFKQLVIKGALKRLREQADILGQIKVTMLNHAITTGQISHNDYQKYKNENLKSMQDARDIFEKERLNEIKDNRK
jgi:precorrin isomerase